MNIGKRIILIAGAVICLLGLGYFIYVQFTDRRVADSYPPTVGGSPVISSEPQMPMEEQQLMEEFDSLHSLDNYYLKSLSDANTSNLYLDSLETGIIEKEKYLKLKIDSLGQLSGADKNGMSKLATFLNNILDSRNMLRIEQGSGEETKANRADDDILLNLVRKNARILDLENQLKEEKEEKMNQAPVFWEEKLKEKDIALMKLQQKYQALDQDYRSVQVVRPENNSSKTPAKQAQEEKVSELEAALRLATVDCNLTRADGRAIIYTSKQRKVLLEESLKILQVLSASDNATVQKQVKERMADLKQIATTIRD